MASFLLDRTLWDLVLDSSGNIAVCTEPYSLIQDVACAIRLFQGELWYDTTQGVPYFQQILGKQPSVSVFKTALQNAALTVPGVVTATVYITAFTDRQISGQVQITNTSGNTLATNF